MNDSTAAHGNGVRAEAPPARRIVIVGAGGFGRETYHWIRDAWPAAADRIAGFLSADAQCPDVHAGLPPIVGDPANFAPDAETGLVLAIGIPGVRRRVAEQLLARGARFLTVIHPTAVVAPTADIGIGSVICPYAIASDAVRLGRFTLMNYHSSLGHDASTGEFAVLSPYATLGGGAEIGADAFLGLHASVGPGKRLGACSKVSANSAVLADAPAESLVHGVPGRVTPLINENGL